MTMFTEQLELLFYTAGIRGSSGCICHVCWAIVL